MKNVGIIVPNLQSGGSERFASTLSKLLLNNYNVYFMVFDSSDSSYELAGEYIDFKLPAKKSYVGKIITFLKRIFKLRKIVSKNDIDVIFSFTAAANNCLALSFIKSKKIISSRGYNYLNKHMKLYHFYAELGCSIFFNSKDMESLYLNKYPNDFSRSLSLYNFFEKDKILELSKIELEDEFRIFYNNHKVITTLSQFSALKGQWNLIKSFELLKKRVPDAGLVFIGHRGEIEKEIQDMADRSKYSKDILFLGYRSNPFKYIANSNVYALCSINEGFPNALIESMMCSIPVVATNCKSGPSEILFESYQYNYTCNDVVMADYGIITPPFKSQIDLNLQNVTKEHHMFSSALEQLLTTDELKKHYSNQSRKRAYQFDKKNVISKYYQLVDNTLEYE